MDEKFKYWISYVVSTVIIAWICSYLIAKCPCNTNMVSGLLYALVCYILLFISIIFHFRRLVQINIPIILLIVTICSIIGSVVIAFIGEDLQQTSAYRMIIDGHFMEYFVTIIVIATFNLIGIIMAYISISHIES